mgnify:CR=1 FL=1
MSAKCLAHRHGCAWTADEDQCLRDHYGKKYNHEIASELGRTPGSIYSRAGEMDLLPKPGRQPSRSTYVQAIAEACEIVGTDLDGALDVTRRRRPHTVARHLGWRNLVANGYSLPGIGRAARKFDHTAILHGIRRAPFHEAWLAKRRAKMAEMPHGAPVSLKIRSAALA